MELHKNLEHIFHEALAQDPKSRAKFLDSACDNNIELRQQIELLLSHRTRSDIFFDDFSSRLDQLNTNSNTISTANETRIGPWKLLSLLGRGGMGSVYLAERADKHYTQHVALKVLSLACHDPISRYRFMSERKILAQLDHKGIAHFIDGGVTECGTQYLAMEYVKGQSINDHCRTKNLKLNDILLLFLEVCETVQHAHDHLVIHRDIKPNNVMVDENGQIKLLDFGIAKIVADSHNMELTQAAFCPLTLGYASPEMLKGDAVGVTSDVYSLGVMLYELLTGQKPYHPCNSPTELRRAHSLSQPKLASTIKGSKKIRRALQGDLDCILAKSISAVPTQRYASVREMASDIKRHLEGFPIRAKPRSTLDHAIKFVRRHRAKTIAICAFTVTLCAAAVFSTLQMLEAHSQRDLARYQQQRVQASNDFLNLLLEEMGPSEQSLTLEELLDRGTAMLDRQYQTKPDFVAHLLFELSQSYLAIGNQVKAEALLDKAESVANHTSDNEILGTILCAKAYTTLLNNPTHGERLYNTAIEVVSHLAQSSVTNTIYCTLAKSRLLEIYQNANAALALIDRTQKNLQRETNIGDNLNLRLINRRITLLYALGRSAEVLAANTQALKIMAEGGRETSVRYMMELQNRAILLSMAGEIQQYAETARQVFDHFVSDRQLNQRPQKFVMRYADALLRLGDYRKALSLYRTSIEEIRSQGNHLYIAHHHLGMGRALVRMGEFEQAEKNFSIAELTYKKNPILARRKLNWIVLERARILRMQGQHHEASRRIESLLTIMNYPKQRAGFQLSQTLREAAETALLLDDISGASHYIDAFMDTAKKLAQSPENSADVGKALLMQAQLFLKQNAMNQAIQNLSLAKVVLSKSAGANHHDTLAAAKLLSEFSSRK